MSSRELFGILHRLRAHRAQVWDEGGSLYKLPMTDVELWVAKLKKEGQIECMLAPKGLQPRLEFSEIP